MKGSQLQVITDPLEGDELVLIVKNRTNRITPISNLIAAATFEDGEPNQFLAWDQTWKEIQFGYLSDVSPYTITEANKYIRVNSDATGLEYASIDLSGYVTKTLDETITGLKTFTNNNGLLIKNPSSTVKALKLGVTSGTSEFVGEIRYDIIGANRIWLLPDKTGTILVDSDLSAYVPKAGATTITGNKYFINNSGTWFSSADESGQLFTGNPIKIQGNTATSPYIGFQGTITSQNLEADRIWYLPNKNGVLATVDDIPADRFYTYTRGVGPYANVEHNRADKSMVLSALSTNHTAVGVSSLLHLLSYGQDQGRAIYVDHNNYGIFSVSWSGGTVVRYKLSLYPNYIGQDTFFDIASPNQTHNIQLRVSEVTGDPITTQYYLPKDGTSGQILSTNGSGVLSWITPSGGSTIPVFSVGTDGLVPGPASSANNIFLASNGTWQTVNAGITTSLQLGDSGTARTGVIKLVADSYMYLSESYVGGETTFTIQHGATSPASSITVSGIERVSAITIDARGHVTALTKNNFPTFSSSSAGLAPSPGSPSGRYLRDDGWAVLPTGTSHDPVSLTGENYITLSGQTLTLNKIGVSQINASGIADNKFLKGNGTWDVPSGGGDYILPLAANGTRGGLQIGYTANGANLPLLLSSEKGYITLTKFAIEAVLTDNITSHTHNYDNYGSWLAAVTGTSGTASITSGSILTFTGAGATTITRVGNTITISSSSGGGGIADIPSGVNKKYLRSRDSLDNAIWEEYIASDSVSFSGSLVNVLGVVTLVNDLSTPGNSKYYGTNSSGVKGWHDYIPGSGDPYELTFMAGSTSFDVVTGSIVQFTIGIGIALSYADNGSGSHTLAYRLDANLTHLNDVEISSPANNQVLRYNGTVWVNSTDTAYSWGDHSAAGYLESLTADGTNNGITIGGTATNPTLKIVSINQAGVGQITVTGSAIGVTLGTTDTTAAAGNHTHALLHQQSHAITSTNDHTATAHQMFYSNRDGQVVELAFGTNKQLLMSNGASSAPSFVNLSSLDAFTYGSKGLVPAPSATEAATETRFLCADGSWSIPAGTGTGMTNPMTATGDIIYRSSSQSATRLGIGSVNQVLSVSSTGIPEWKTLASTFVMNITGDVVAGTNQVATLQNSAVSRGAENTITSLDASDLFLVSQDDVLKSITAGNIQKYIVPFTTKGQLLYGGESGAVAVLPANSTGTRTILSQISSNTSWLAHTFNNLNDTAVYSLANALNLVRVNGSGTGLEYMSVAVAATSLLRIDGSVLSAKLQNETAPVLGGELNANTKSITALAHITPSLAAGVAAYDLGSSTKKWRVGYIDKLVTNEHIFLGNGTSGYYAGNQNGDAKYRYVEATEIRSTMIKLGTDKFAIRYNGGNLEFMFNNAVVAEMTIDGNMIFMKS